MKKVFITLALTAIAATSAFAQISVGGGYLNSTSKTTIANTSTPTNANGFYVGADATLNLVGDDVVMMPGLYYNLTSSKGKASTTTNQGLYVPVHFAYMLPVANEVKVFPFAGPQFNIGLSSVVKTETLGITTEFNNYSDEGNVSRFNLAMTAGVGVDIMDLVRVKFAYNWGLLDLHKSDNVQLSNSNWQIGVAILF